MKAEFILSAIGSLEKAKIRFANQVISTGFNRTFDKQTGYLELEIILNHS
ncbi:hypothetical protein [uncultured Nostoc sp.]|nr:hypothetical protein [uncultured Nostoc sp.]